MAREIIKSPNEFYSPEKFAREQSQHSESPRGRLLIASCRSGDEIAFGVAERYREYISKIDTVGEVLHLSSIDGQFSDSETFVRLGMDVSGYDVFLFQALFDPRSERSIDENYAALLIASRAFREWGANNVTAMLPYLAYARQDKPTKFKREPTTARLMADLSIAAGITRMSTWHPHSPQTQGFYDHVPVDRLEALPLFTQVFRRFENQDDVIAVAPDAGASKFVTYFSRELNLNSAIASKRRPRPEEAVITEVIGDFRGKKTAVILDDMISSGGTVHAVVKELVERKGIEEVYIGVSHHLCTPAAWERLSELHEKYNLRELVITNSIPQTDAFQGLPFLNIKDLSDVLALVINRIHYNRPVTELFYERSQEERK